MPVRNPFRFESLTRSNAYYYISNALQWGWDILKIALGIQRHFPDLTQAERTQIWNKAQQARQTGRGMWQDHEFFPDEQDIPFNDSLPKGYRYILTLRCVNIETRQVSDTTVVVDDNRQLTWADIDRLVTPLVEVRAISGSPNLPGDILDRVSCALLAIDSIERS